MLLTKMTRYGTRAVFDIAYHSSGSPVHLRDVAMRQEMSVKHLEQIFHKLKKADFIKSERGPTGGYSLIKNPREITVGDIVRAVDEPLDLVCCVSDAILVINQNSASQDLCGRRPVEELKIILIL